MILLLFPKLHNGSPVRVWANVLTVVHKVPSPFPFWSQLLLLPILVWPTWRSLDLSRMLSLEASSLHVSTSNLISSKSAHMSPDHPIQNCNLSPIPFRGPLHPSDPTLPVYIHDFNCFQTHRLLLSLQLLVLLFLIRTLHIAPPICRLS